MYTSDFFLAMKNLQLYGMIGPTCLEDIHLLLFYYHNSDPFTKLLRGTENMHMVSFTHDFLIQIEKLHNLVGGEVVFFVAIQMLGAPSLVWRVC